MCAGTRKPRVDLATLFSAGSKKPGGEIRLGEGEYTAAQLLAAGIPDKSITALKVNAGWSVQLFEQDNFGGRSVTSTAMVRVLSCAEFKFDRKTSSLKVTKAASAMNLQ